MPVHTLRPLMIQGTASGVGKSFLTAGLCRLFTRRGLRVAPFKAMNMSNNAAPALGQDGRWGEIGRAQAVQAEACRRAPEVDFNPVLIKPDGPNGAQVIVDGHPVGRLGPGGWKGARDWWEVITAAWARVVASADLVILEGAGSPAEINLRDTDLANMRMAAHADAAVWLVGDIDRGGVFASLHGTVALLTPEERARVTGILINRFRGEPERLRPGLVPLEQMTGVPVRGVVPWRDDLRPDEEDATELGEVRGGLDVVGLKLPTLSNFTDLAALAGCPGVGVRWVDRPEALGNPDLLVLPGSKNTVYDLGWLRSVGLDRSVLAAAKRGIPVLGLCGGYQMLGQHIREGRTRVPGLGLLSIETTMAAEKTVTPVKGRTAGTWLLPANLPVLGYEIHYGQSVRRGGRPLLEGEGAISGSVAGTYLHGLLDEPGVRAALLTALWERKGLTPPSGDEALRREALYEAMADHVERWVDVGVVGG